jgi:probable rRNA maturation factor
MRAEGCETKAQLSLLLCCDRRIRGLNRTWRRKDKATDVLSFAQENASEAANFIPREQVRSPLLLGDVVISIDSAARQAKAAGIPLEDEMRFLLVHGILHLLGWEDTSPAQRKKMLARQEEILQSQKPAARRGK